MNVTLVGTTILVRPDLSKAADPIEITDLQSMGKNDTFLSTTYVVANNDDVRWNFSE